MLNERVRVLIVDDHEIVREGLQTLLAEETAIEVVGLAANGMQAVEMAVALAPDVILMDLVMPVMDGIEAIHRLQAVNSAAQVIVLTSFADDQRVHAAINAGAISYLLKDVLKPELLNAISLAAQGKSTFHAEALKALIRPTRDAESLEVKIALTEREQDVLRLVAQGKSNKEIASELFLSEGTVKGYMSAILAKIGVADRTQAALFAIKHKLVSD
jgi:NarL family two-component system response regulator LiaR